MRMQVLHGLIVLSTLMTPAFGDAPDAGSPSVDALIHSLADTDEQARSAASKALTAMGPAVVPHLVRSLERADASTRMEIAFTLGQMEAQGAAAVPHLVKMLRDDAPEVRSFAAFALGRIGRHARKAVPALTEMAHSNEPKLQRAAESALARILGDGDAKAPEPLDVDLTAVEIPTIELQSGTDNEEFSPFFDDLSDSELPAAAGEQPDEQNGRLAGTAGLAGDSVDSLGLNAFDESEDYRKIHNPDDLNAFDADTLFDDAAVEDEPLDVPERVGSRPAPSAAAAGTSNSFDDGADAAGAVLFDLAEPQEQTAPVENTPPSGSEQRTANRPAATVTPNVHIDPPRPHTSWPALSWQPIIWAASAAAAWVLFWTTCWVLLLWLRPLWLMSLSNAVARSFDPRLPGRRWRRILSLRHLLVLRPWQYHVRVLDAWLERHSEHLVANFWQWDSCREHRLHVPLSIDVNWSPVQRFGPEKLQRTFADAKCVLITGDSGIGKSSMACRIADWGLRKQLTGHVMLPVVIRYDSEQPMFAIIREQLESLLGAPAMIPDGLLRALVRHRKILPIVDSASGESEETASILSKAGSVLSGTVVVSSLEDRIPGLEAGLTLQPSRLSGDQLSSFVAGYLELAHKRELFSDVEYFEACRCLSALGRNRGLKACIARLFTEHMVFSKQQYGTATLPASIPALMMHYLHAVNLSRGNAELDDRTVQDDMQRIARLSLSRRLRPSDVSGESVLRDLPGQGVPSRLAYLEKTLRLIERHTGDGVRFRIRINPLAEYLAGAQLVAAHRDNAPRWQSYLGRVERMPQGSAEVKSYLLAVLDCCLAFAPGVPDAVPAKLGQLAGLDSEEVQQEIVCKRIHRAVDALTTGDAGIRRKAATALQECGPLADDAVPALIRALGDDDEEVRLRAADALQNVGHDAVGALCWALSDPNSVVRRAAAAALGQIGPAALPAIPQLRESLADGHFAVRAAIAAALGAIGRTETVPDLIRALNDEHAYVRASGVQALGRMGEAARSAVHYLRKTLLDEHVEVRRLTAQALGEIGAAAKSAVPELIESLLDADPQVCREAAESLLRIGVHAVPSLVRALHSPDSAVRQTSAFVLGSLGSDAEAAIGALIAALRDRDVSVRETAADALEQIHRSVPARSVAA